MCCGYASGAPRRGVSKEYPKDMFLWRNKKQITNFGYKSVLSKTKANEYIYLGPLIQGKTKNKEVSQTRETVSFCYDVSLKENSK